MSEKMDEMGVVGEEVPGEGGEGSQERGGGFAKERGKSRSEREEK